MNPPPSTLELNAETYEMTSHIVTPLMSGTYPREWERCTIRTTRRTTTALCPGASTGPRTCTQRYTLVPVLNSTKRRSIYIHIHRHFIHAYLSISSIRSLQFIRTNTNIDVYLLPACLPSSLSSCLASCLLSFFPGFRQRDLHRTGQHLPGTSLLILCVRHC